MDGKNVDELLNLKREIDERINFINENTKPKSVEKPNNHTKSRGILSKYFKAFQKSIDIDPGRLMGLTDGIFGMVMTLLIFAMALPKIQFVTEGDFIGFIHSTLPSVGITLVSFILIASLWIYHHEFIKINSINMPYLWLNVIFLACMSFIPFSISMIGSYCFLSADLLFDLNIFSALLFLMLMFKYADKMNFLEDNLAKIEKNYIYHTLAIVMGFAIIVNFLDLFISRGGVYLSFLFQ